MQHTMHLHGWAQPAAGLASRHGRVRRAVADRAAALPAKAVLWVDGSPVAEAPASPQPVLADRPSGAYTTAYVADGTHIVDWPRHLERLYWNMRRLHDSRPPAFAGCLAWLQQEGSQPEARLQQLLAPQIHQALTHLHNQQCGPQPALLVVSLEDVATRHSSSSSSSSGGGGDGETSAGVSSPAAAPMSHPVQEAAAGSSSSSNTVSHGLSCAVYCKVVPPVPLSPLPVEVLAAGNPRPLPHVKYNQWVIDRRPLEALKAAAGVDEVILVGPGHRLVEGLASNFYVIEHTAAGPVLHTNSPQEAALPGVTQQRVLEAALQLGLTVQLSAPALREADTWQEAFLTNCLRGIQPVSCIKWNTSDQPGPAGEDYVVLPSPPGPITQQLQQLVQQLQEATPVADWQ